LFFIAFIWKVYGGCQWKGEEQTSQTIHILNSKSQVNFIIYQTIPNADRSDPKRPNQYPVSFLFIQHPKSSFLDFDRRNAWIIDNSLSILVFTNTDS